MGNDPALIRAFAGIGRSLDAGGTANAGVPGRPICNVTKPRRTGYVAADLQECAVSFTPSAVPFRRSALPAEYCPGRGSRQSHAFRRRECHACDHAP
jgi:hypothetical protein